MATQLRANSKYSEAEWTARQELAACYRIFAMMGWDELIFNHITVKLEDQEGAFLINPYGMHFGEITASSLIKIDIDGNKLDADNPWHVNKAGFVQHSLFHRELPDAHAIVHTHTTATVAVCSLEGGLQPVNFYACNFMGQLAYHDFEGVTVREEEGVRLIENLGNKRILMLKNHGPVVMGKSLPDMFIKYWALQRACEHQMATMQMGQPVVVPPEVIAVHQRDLYMASPPGGSGKVEFDAMVRKVDQIDKKLAGLSFALRTAVPGDGQAVSNLLRASYATLLAPDYEPGLLATLLPRIGRANPVLLRSGRFYVIEGADGGILACGGWSPEIPGTNRVIPGEAHVRHFATHPSAIRMGAGRSILAHCIERARAAGNHILHCYSTHTGVPFYETLGFRSLEDIIVPIPGTVGMPSVLMRLDLGDKLR